MGETIGPDSDFIQGRDQNKAKLPPVLLVLSEEGGPSPVDELLARHLAPAVALFRSKARDYSERSGIFTADLLGAKGQFAEIWRKIPKLKKGMWDEEHLENETVEEILYDILGHVLLALDHLPDSQRIKKPNLPLGIRDIKVTPYIPPAQGGSGSPGLGGGFIGGVTMGFASPGGSESISGDDKPIKTSCEARVEFKAEDMVVNHFPETEPETGMKPYKNDIDWLEKLHHNHHASNCVFHYQATVPDSLCISCDKWRKQEAGPNKPIPKPTTKNKDGNGGNFYV